MKILVNAFPMANVNTGIGRYLHCLYEALEKDYGNRLEIGYFDGKRVSPAMPSGPENLTRWSNLVSLFWQLPAYPALLLRLLFHSNQQLRFRRFVGEFDIYHEAAFFPFLTPAHVKTVFTIHDLSLVRFPQHHPRERVLYSRFFLRRRCEDVDHFLAVSEFTAREMRTFLGIAPQRTTVTLEAHDKRIFYPRSPEEVRDLLRDHALPEEYFLFAGAGDPRKNMDVIPKALDKAGLDVPLVVAGWSGWSGGAVSKRVVPLGFISDEDLARAYSGAMGMIFPSTYEGFGLPVLEAMACGCPVVTTRETSLPEVAGDAALYMKDPEDVEGLAAMLKNLSVNPACRCRWAEKGLVQARRFSWQNTAETTFKAFEQVIREG